MSSMNTQPKHLFDIPGEIRNLIYSFCFLPQTTKTGRKHRGTSNVLVICKRIYSESHHFLHSPLRTLQLYRNPLTNIRPTPLFRHRKTTYKSSVGLFTAAEFRRFTNIELDIEYLSWRDALLNGPNPLNQDIQNRMHYALRVLANSHGLETVTLKLKARDPWTGIVPDWQIPQNFTQTKSQLAPFLRLGGLHTKICAENALKKDDQVVDWLNQSRRRRVQKLISRLLNESNSNASLLAIRNLFGEPDEIEQVQIQHEPLHGLGQLFPPWLLIYSAAEREASMQQKQSILVDLRKLFDTPDCGNQPIPARNFKCAECLMAFESTRLLAAHKNFSIHTAKEIRHDRFDVPLAVNKYCRNNHSHDLHYKRRPDSAFKCTTCFSKFSYLEGLEVHMEFWKHIKYDLTKTLEDIGRLFDPLYKPLSTGFECRKCFSVYKSKNLLYQHVRRTKHFQNPTLPSPLKVQNSEQPEKKTYRCGTCDDIFPTKSELFSHFRTLGHRCRLLDDVKGYWYNDENGEAGPPVPDEHLYTCENCDGLFETDLHLQTHIKEVNASRYAEPGHFIKICHPSIPARRPGRIFCRHPRCNMSFASKGCHGRSWHRHEGWTWPPKWKWVRFVKRKISRPFVQVRLPVESMQGFTCGKCGGWWETRNLLQKHLEHRVVGCRDEVSGRGVM